jgi:hypothetical protein
VQLLRKGAGASYLLFLSKGNTREVAAAEIQQPASFPLLCVSG